VTLNNRPASHATAPPRKSEAPNGLLEATPGLVRIAAAAWRNTAEWTVGASARAGSRLVRAAMSEEPPTEFLRKSGAEVRDYARRLLGIRGSDDEPADAAADSSANPSLRDRGAELLRRSADVHFEEDTHPAYARILGDLAPDEGRILRLLALRGPQPAVDVRSGWLPISVGSQLLAPGLSMIGAEAGCRHPDRVHAYFNNLNRLGLIWFSRESLEDPRHYQVLEAQPEVVEAMREARRSHTVRRSIHLTPFGEDFCQMCLPIETAELDALPAPLRSGGEGESRSRYSP
jgi:abortive infection alpha-like protein